jgi:hypothetical protein
VPAYWFALVQAFEERSTVLACLRGETRFVALARRLTGQ